MADNTRIVYTTDDQKTDYLADSVAQANRSYFTPGKAISGTPGDAQKYEMEWPVEFPIKVGNSFVDSQGTRQIRVIKTGRGTVCDQTVLDPVSEGTEFVADDSGSVAGEHTFTDNANVELDGTNERNSGYDGVQTS